MKKRPVLIDANFSKSSSDNLPIAFVMVPIAIKEEPAPNIAHGKYCVCSITFKPVSPQLAPPRIVPYIAARPLTASTYFQFTDACVLNLNELRFFSLIGKRVFLVLNIDCILFFFIIFLFL